MRDREWEPMGRECHENQKSELGMRYPFCELPHKNLFTAQFKMIAYNVATVRSNSNLTSITRIKIQLLIKMAALFKIYFTFTLVHFQYDLLLLIIKF